MHTITPRPPTPEEQHILAVRAKPDVVSYAGLIIFFAIVPTYFLGRLGVVLGGAISRDAATYGQWIGWFLALGLFVSVLAWFTPYEQRQRQKAVQDYEAQIVEEINIVDARVIEIAIISDNEPIFAFDIGDNKILFLQGQWLRDSTTYGVVAGEEEPIEETINGLPEPNSFPNDAFRVSRTPIRGEVLGIRVSGKYLAPQGVVEALQPEYEFGDSELFEGSLEDIAEVLTREHGRRHGG